MLSKDGCIYISTLHQNIIIQKKIQEGKHEINCRMICRVLVSRTHHHTINNNIISTITKKKKRNIYIYKGKIEKERNC